MTSHSPQRQLFMEESTVENYSRLLSGMNLFSRLDRASLRELALKARLLQVPRREVLVKNGQQLTELHCLVEGTLKVYLLSCSGQQRVISLLHPGESVGEALIISRKPVPFFVETLTPARLLVLPTKELLELLASNADAGMGMAQILSQKMLTLLQDLEGCCLHNAMQRIAQYLCNLNCQQNGESRTVILPASKVVVASLLNLSAESLSRGLHQLAGEGLISVRRRMIDLHEPATLQDIARGQLQFPNH